MRFEQASAVVPLKDGPKELSSVQRMALDYLVCIPRPRSFMPSLRTLRSLRALGYAAHSLHGEGGFRITNAGRRKWNEFNEGSSGL